MLANDPPVAAKIHEDRTQVIRMRREMKEAVEREDYERASELRDQINSSKETSVEVR